VFSPFWKLPPEVALEAMWEKEFTRERSLWWDRPPHPPLGSFNILIS